MRYGETKLITIVMVLMVLLTPSASVIFDNDGATEEIFIGEFVVEKDDIIRERIFDTETRVYATTTTGEKAYVIYNDTTVKAKIWTDNGVQRIISNGFITPLL